MTRRKWPINCVALLCLGALTLGCSEDYRILGVPGPGNGTTLPTITVPVALGNMWVYTTDTDTSTARALATDTTRVVGTELFDGETWYVLESTTAECTNRSLFRQVGQDLFVMPSMGEAGSQDPFQEWMDQITSASLPWKMADLDAPSGSQWVEIDSSSQFELGGSPVTVRCQLYPDSMAP